MWIYYYATHGPGHQSTTADFMEFSDDYTREGIKDYLFDYTLSDLYNISLRFWKVERPSKTFLDDKIKYIREDIDRLTKRLETLEQQGGFRKIQTEDADEDIKNALKKRHNEDILYLLHKEGFMYSHEDIKNWYWGKKSPSKDDRKEVLKIIKKVKSY